MQVKWDPLNPWNCFPAFTAFFPMSVWARIRLFICIFNVQIFLLVGIYVEEVTV